MPKKKETAPAGPKEPRGRKLKYENQPETIKCLGCQETKDRSEFSSSSSMRGSGTSSYCKECQVDINTQYRYRKIAKDDPDKLHTMRHELTKRIQFIDEALADPQPEIRKTRLT